MAARIHSFHRLGGRGHSEAADERIDSQLAVALRDRLSEAGHAQLASTVERLRVVEHCRCGEAGCESFYTVPARRVRQLWGTGGQTIELAPGLAVDVIDGEIVAVEILHDRSE